MIAHPTFLDELRALCVKYSGSSFTRLANKVADLVVRCDSTGGGDMQAEAAVSYGSTDSTQLNPIRHHRQLSLNSDAFPVYISPFVSDFFLTFNASSIRCSSRLQLSLFYI